jgi:drug/metabolite transporter (DMT)-like permease
MPGKQIKTFAIPVLFAGAIGIAFAPIFVRLSEVGPAATAFYRLLFAVPLLWAWTRGDVYSAARGRRDAPKKPQTRYEWKWICLAGLFFAGDLAVWHWSITFTTVANATLFANFAPIFVTFGAWILFKERITWLFVWGLAFALGGAALLIGISFGLGERQVLGDGLGLITAVFYAGYILSIKRVRSMFSTSVTMLWSGIVTCIALFVIAFLTEDRMLAASLYGWSVLVGLAVISHAGGQAMIAYALAHLPASFASVGLLLQPAAAALLAWIVLDETLGPLQGAGGVLVLTGIFLAWRGSSIRPESAVKPTENVNP